tara:strand:+ start:333 stop:566 length:234 start_codon:yes stop_codon:yes gene_type:complete
MLVQLCAWKKVVKNRKESAIRRRKIVACKSGQNVLHVDNTNCTINTRMDGAGGQVFCSIIDFCNFSLPFIAKNGKIK